MSVLRCHCFIKKDVHAICRSMKVDLVVLCLCSTLPLFHNWRQACFFRACVDKNTICDIVSNSTATLRCVQ